MTVEHPRFPASIPQSIRIETAKQRLSGACSAIESAWHSDTIVKGRVDGSAWLGKAHAVELEEQAARRMAAAQPHSPEFQRAKGEVIALAQLVRYPYAAERLLQLYSQALERLVESPGLHLPRDVHMVSDRAYEQVDQHEALRSHRKDPVMLAKSRELARLMYAAREYEFGTNRKKPNSHLAAEAYRRAAESGLVEAQTKYGTLLEAGHGVDQSYAEAHRWYKKAAELGDVYAAEHVERLEHTMPRVLATGNAQLYRPTSFNSLLSFGASSQGSR